MASTPSEKGGSNNKNAALASGNILWSKVPKANAELFSLTYGALVTEVLRDYGEDNISVVNEQLEKMGHSIGVRCVDEYLAKCNPSQVRCQTFLETAEVLAKSALKMFLGITADVVVPSVPLAEEGGGGSGRGAEGSGAGAADESASSSPQQFSLYLYDNPLSIFVELPEKLQDKLEYNILYCGVLRGALEMLNMRVECTMVRSTLRGDDLNEIKVELKEVMAEGAGDDYKTE